MVPVLTSISMRMIWKVAQLVKAADLGYISTNLEDIPSKQEKKDEEKRRAIRNLTAAEPPERLTLTNLPESLLKG